MPAAFPRSAREALGAEAAEDLDAYFHTLHREHTIDPSEYRADMAEVKARLGALEQGHVELRQEVGGLRQEVNDFGREVNNPSCVLPPSRRVAHPKGTRYAALPRDASLGGCLPTPASGAAEPPRRSVPRQSRGTSTIGHNLGWLNTRLDNMQYQMLVQTRWLIGAVSLFGTIIAILLAIGQLT